jgi:hypothetical protein
LPAALAAPPGTTAAGSPSGSTTVAANGSTAWTLTADVDDADPAGTVLTQLPGAVSYGMSAIGLAPRAVAVTPAVVTSTVIVPDVTNSDVTINQASGQPDPTSTSPIHFTVTFSESVTGFDAADVDLTASSVGGVLSSVVTGGGSTYTVDVSGMTTGGTVVASIPAFAAIDASSNPSNASTSLDHTVTWVQSIASSVSVALTPTSRVYGQPAQAAATVGVTSGTPAGTVQFDVDGADVGSPVAVGAGGIAVSPTLTGSGGAAPTAGSHTVTATFTPTDPVTYAGSNGSTGLVVDKAATEVSVSVAPTSLHATVTATAPGAGEPGGTVTFSVDGQSVGSAPVSGGAAQLSYKTPSGKTRHIAALYSGDANFTASSASTARHDPAITAHASSAHAKTSYGWYRSSVTVTFTCATNGAPLVASCPSPVTLTHNGAAQSVSRTISATDGGMATATAHGINLDHSLPIVKVTGVTNGGRYARPGPTPHCTPSDALSGVASCTLTRYSTRHGDVTTVHYTGTAKDKAGNARATSGTFQLSSFARSKGSPSAPAPTRCTAGTPICSW